MTEPKTMTVPEAAEILGISRNAAYEAVGRGEIPAIRIGKRLVVPIAAFNRLMFEEKPNERPAPTSLIRAPQRLPKST